jgi:hypothetical protein
MVFVQQVPPGFRDFEWGKFRRTGCPANSGRSRAKPHHSLQRGMVPFARGCANTRGKRRDLSSSGWSGKYSYTYYERRPGGHIGAPRSTDAHALGLSSSSRNNVHQQHRTLLRRAAAQDYGTMLRKMELLNAFLVVEPTFHQFLPDTQQIPI